jgi:hypothetical protein
LWRCFLVLLDANGGRKVTATAHFRGVPQYQARPDNRL